jgi:hypothetical protein
MKFSRKAERELRAAIEMLKLNAEVLRHNRHNPFIKNGKVDVEAYIQFIIEYNEFINHAPKPFEPIIDRDMRL